MNLFDVSVGQHIGCEIQFDGKTGYKHNIIISSYPRYCLYCNPSYLYSAYSMLSLFLMGSSGARSDEGQARRIAYRVSLGLHNYRPCMIGIFNAKTKSETQQRTIGWTPDCIAWKSEGPKPRYMNATFKLLHSHPLPLLSLASFERSRHFEILI